MSDERSEQRDPWQPFRLAGGWLLLVFGLVLFPMPIPAGLAMVAGGAALLVHDSRTFRRLLTCLKRRFPRFFSALHEKATRLPPWMARRIKHLLEHDEN
jgi:lauroyl/myristoyl acyltransferase